MSNRDEDLTYDPRPDTVRMPYVYVAGPMTRPDFISTTRTACELHLRLLEDRVVIPFLPHLSVLQALVTPTPSTDLDFWLRHDFDVIDNADAVLRMPGESTGADRETTYCETGRSGLGEIPVFYMRHAGHLGALYDWADAWSARHPRTPAPHAEQGS